jgi:hypothetical protein
MKEANRRNKLRECQPGNCTVVALLGVRQTKEGVCICTIKAESGGCGRKSAAIFAASQMQKLGRRIFKTSESVALWASERAPCLPLSRARMGVCRLLVSFVGRRFSVSPSYSSRDHREMLGRLGVSQAATHVFYRGPASKPKLRCTFSYRLSLAPLFAQPFKMLMSSFFISLASTPYKIPIKLTLLAGRLKKILVPPLKRSRGKLRQHDVATFLCRVQ